MEFWPNIIDSRMVNIKKSVYRILDKKKKNRVCKQNILRFIVGCVPVHCLAV